MLAIDFPPRLVSPQSWTGRCPYERDA